MFSYTRREALELVRDPIRATLATIGTVILMFVIGYGINMDVEDLTFAVLDRDQTTTSREYILEIAGSRYFIEKDPITDYADLDRRMRNGELSLAIEIPPGLPGMRRAATRCKSPPGSMARWRAVPKRSKATCRGCTPIG